MPAPIVIRNTQRPEPFGVVGESITVLARGQQTDSYELFLQVGPAEVGPPPHRHAWAEAFFVLDGEIEVTVDGTATKLGPGDFALVPPNTTHSYRNVTDCRMLSINSRRGAAEFFADVSAKVGLPPDVPKLLELGEEHGVEFVLPGPQ